MIADGGFIDRIMLTLGIGLIVWGIAALVRRKPIGVGIEPEEYTEESQESYAMALGRQNIVIGIGFVSCNIQMAPFNTVVAEVGKLSVKVGFIILVLAILIYLFLVIKDKNILVKK
ncbi:MAG: hypothetical protein Q4B59_00070 [Lachnospiraceae bacterium]|nr:hypothetical protein [Lachnospiraceae bacterium]